MIIDTTKFHFMPLIMGLDLDRENPPGMVYTETESLMLQYKTDPNAIQPLLPDFYQPGKDPLVSVAIMHSNGVNFSDEHHFMAGNGYRLAAVQVAARYDGKEDHLDGDYILVMFENDTLPIIAGREVLGISKSYADISSIKVMDNKHLRCDVSLWGHLLFGVDLEPLESQNSDVCSAASERASKWPRFGYKYIDSFEGPPDANYPTVLWTDNTIEQLWIGKSAELYFGNPGEKDIGIITPVINALKSLPVLTITQTVHSRGSQTIRTDKCRRLR